MRDRPFEPPGSDTFNLTEYEPAFTYACTGFCSVEEVPSPNVHNHLVGLPVVRSWKKTTRGSAPVFGSALKPAFRTPGSGVGVGVGVGVWVGVGVGVGKAVGEGAGVGVCEGDGVGVGVTVGADVGVGETVGVGVG